MTGQAAQGVRPATTADTTAFTAFIDTEIMRVFICNTSAVARTFRLFHVPAGGAPGLDNAQIAANDTVSLTSDAPNSGIQLSPAICSECAVQCE